MNLDKFLKILWLVNGIGLLILLIVIVFVAISEIDLIPGFNNYDSYTVVSEEGGSFKLNYNDPEPLYKTGTYVLAVGVDQYIEHDSPYSENVYYSDGYHSCVNVIFLDQNLQPTKTLLDQKAYISDFRFPSANLYTETDTTAKHLIYLIALRDTNNDGKIDQDDDTNLYLSDLSGNNLRQITNDLVVLNYSFIQQGQKLRIDYLKKEDKAESNRHFAVYHIAGQKLEELTTLDASLNSIQSLYKP